MSIFSKLKKTTLSLLLLITFSFNRNATAAVGASFNVISEMENKFNVNKCNSLFEVVHLGSMSTHSQQTPLALVPQDKIKTIFRPSPKNETTPLRQRLHEVAFLQAGGDTASTQVHEENMLTVANALSNLQRFANNNLWQEFITESNHSQNLESLWSFISNNFSNFPDIRRINTKPELHSAALDLLFILRLHTDSLIQLEAQKLAMTLTTSSQDQASQARLLLIISLIGGLNLAFGAESNSFVIPSILSSMTLLSTARLVFMFKNHYDTIKNQPEALDGPISELPLKEKLFHLPEVGRELKNSIDQIHLKPNQSLSLPHKSEDFNSNDNPLIQDFIRELGKDVAGRFSIGSDFEQVISYQAQYKNLILHLLDLDSHFAQNDILVAFFELGQFNYSSHKGLAQIMNDPLFHSPFANKLKIIISNLDIKNPVEIKNLLYAITPWLSEMRLDEYYGQLQMANDTFIWKAEDLRQLDLVIKSIEQALLRKQGQKYGFINSHKNEELIQWKHSILNIIELILDQNSKTYGGSFIDFFIHSDFQNADNFNPQKSLSETSPKRAPSQDSSNENPLALDRAVQNIDWLNSPEAETLRISLKNLDMKSYQTKHITAALNIMRDNLRAELSMSPMMTSSSPSAHQVVSFELLNKIDPFNSLEFSKSSGNYVIYGRELSPYFHYIHQTTMQIHNNLISTIKELNELKSQFFPYSNWKLVGGVLQKIRLKLNSNKISPDEMEDLLLKIKILELNLNIQLKKIAELQKIIPAVQEKVQTFQSTANNSNNANKFISSSHNSTSSYGKENLSQEQLEDLKQSQARLKMENDSLLFSSQQLADQVKLSHKASSLLYTLQISIRNLYGHD